MHRKKAVVLWTGGKDCNLALYEARKAGYEIVSLITFAAGHARFRAHPLHFIKQQARALGIPHVVVPVNEPYREGYEAAISGIKQEYKIQTIVTGDISEIHGNTNWITDRSKPSGVNVFLPLWHLEREQLLQQIIALNFKVIFSCVKEPWFTLDWLGRELNTAILEELKLMHTRQGLDICGEQGEYHTLVLDGPEYHSEIFIDSFSGQKEEGLMYMQIENISLKIKQAV